MSLSLAYWTCLVLLGSLNSSESFLFVYGFQTSDSLQTETGLGDMGRFLCCSGLCDAVLLNLGCSGPGCELGSFHVPLSESVPGGRLQTPPGEERPCWKEGDKTPGQISRRRWGEHGEPPSHLDKLLRRLRPPSFAARPSTAGHRPCLLFLASKMDLFGEMFPGSSLKSQWDGWVSVARKAEGPVGRWERLGASRTRHPRGCSLGASPPWAQGTAAI